MNKLIKRFSIILQMSITQFINYNFLCKSIHRDKGCYIIPYRGTRMNLEKGCEIELHAHLILNALKHKHSREEMYLHMFPGSRLIIEGRTLFATCSSLDLLADSEMRLGELETNYGTVIVCCNKMTIGDGTQFGRNVLIYDSNHHPTKFNSNIKGRPLTIGKHVWLCTGVCIAQGITIGDGAICGLNSTVTRNVKPYTLVMGNPAKCVMENVEW